MKKIFLSLFVLLGTANLSFAVELPSVMKQTMAQDPIGMPSLLNLVLSMVFVIALIYFTGWVYAKLNVINKDKLKKITSDNTDCKRFAVLQSMPLGQQRHLYSIEMNGKILLVGSTPSHITLLKEFDAKTDKEEVSVDAVINSEDNDEDDNSPIQKSFDIDELYKKYKN